MNNSSAVWAVAVVMDSVCACDQWMERLEAWLESQRNPPATPVYHGVDMYSTSIPDNGIRIVGNSIGNIESLQL